MVHSMMLKALGYAGFGSDKLDDWHAFGTDVLGFQCDARSASLLPFRMDDRQQRVFIDGSLPEGQGCFGWEVEDGDALDRMAGHLENNNVPVTLEPDARAEARRVARLISFDDPIGNRLEVFCDAYTAATPFAPARALSGFRTGGLGLGHIVFTVPRIEDVLPFYRDILGFGVSDYMRAPFQAYFLHVNARHHSLALIETGKAGIHHLMVEACSLDDVGQALDLATTHDAVNVSLGRHTNDFMTSFYSKTPGSFMVEFGWGGREIDPRNWHAAELSEGPSLWGHERYWLPEKDREIARQMRVEAAANGHRQPVQVMPGNFVEMSDACPWFARSQDRKAASGD